MVHMFEDRSNKTITFGTANDVIAKLSTVWSNPVMMQRIYPVIGNVFANAQLHQSVIENHWQLALNCALNEFTLLPDELAKLERLHDMFILALTD